MDEARKLTKLDEECYEIELADGDCEAFRIDSASVLLELRRGSGLYGIFYTAKGLQWDIWSDTAEEEGRQDITYALRDPVRAACELLNHNWRPDFEYDPEENAE